MEKVYDMVIIGGGPGGYTAALYAARAGFTSLVLEKQCAGGQMALTAHIDNYPGFEQTVDGFALGQAMQAGAERFGAETVITEVTKVDLNATPRVIDTDAGRFSGRCIVLAMGAEPRKLGVPGEEALTGRGVSYCATCDGMLYRGKTVAVVGGGNTAAADALLLSRVAAHVHLIHRRDTLRATKVYHQPLMEAENVTFHWNSTVTAVLGGDRLTGITIRNENTGEETELPCDGLFVSIGRAPATQLVREQLQLDPAGYIPADESTQTGLDGVYAVGDVRTKALRQIITAAADGAAAAHHAEEYLLH